MIFLEIEPLPDSLIEAIEVAVRDAIAFKERGETPPPVARFGGGMMVDGAMGPRTMNAMLNPLPPKPRESKPISTSYKPSEDDQGLFNLPMSIAVGFPFPNF